MSNLMTVPHTVTFEAVIDLDKIPSNLLPALVSMDAYSIEKMCKGATLYALAEAKVLQIANENNTWAEVTIKEGN
jgi:16S rRNA U516 pseudouridylate synthase RsuA-like enzyme